MTDPFRWKNCFADVLSARNGLIAQSYIRDIVEPSLTAMENQIAALRARPEDPLAIFGIGPAEELLRATLTGYCLSIQSMWEKQIRAYLDRCARDLQLDSDVIVKIQRADWSLLNSIFEQLRGVPLTAFDEYPTLSQMQLLGNVCRHGQGPSLERLICAHPELWPSLPNQHLPPPGSPYLHVRTAETLRVSLDLLKSFAAAINSFWDETEYIYNESIQAKSEQLERVLVAERKRRGGRGRPWDPAASG